MNRTKILVAGSTNMDMVINTAAFPAPGETIVGQRFFMNFGGKGANQAVASARLGGHVIFAARTGSDIFGEQMRTNLKNENIDLRFLKTDPDEPSGIALITVNADGENTIVISPGANARLSPEDIDRLIPELMEIKVILMQLETPMETVKHLASLGNVQGKTVILNPAPAKPLENDLLKNLTIITPNETEAELLTGITIHGPDTAFKAAKALKAKGPEAVIITLGSHGAILYSDNEKAHIPALRAKAVDTTAAGDTFNGALAVMLAEGRSLKEAVVFANSAAALSVQKEGAQQSIPYRQDIEKQNI